MRRRDFLMTLLLPTASLLAQDFQITPAQGYRSAEPVFTIAPINRDISGLEYPDPPTTTPETKPEAQPEHRIIYYFTKKGCAPCARWQKVEQPKLEKLGFKIGKTGSVNILVIDVNEYPKFADTFGIDEVPTFIGLYKKQALISNTGYIEAQQIVDMYNDLGPGLKTALAIAKQKPPPPPRNVGVRLPAPGPGWTWPGSLADHLASTHGIRVAGMNQRVLQYAHDALHNGRYSPAQINAYFASIR